MRGKRYVGTEYLQGAKTDKKEHRKQSDAVWTAAPRASPVHPATEEAIQSGMTTNEK